MTTITFNPENWVQDEASLTIEGNSIHIKGETLTLEQMPPTFNDSDITNPEWDFHCFKLFFDGRKVGSISKFGKDSEWELLGAGLDRQHSNPFILAGIWASNCI